MCSRKKDSQSSANTHDDGEVVVTKQNTNNIQNTSIISISLYASHQHINSIVDELAYFNFCHILKN